MKEISLEIIKYDTDFTKRSKDLKRNIWFSFPNDLLLHPDFVDITGEEFKWFVWCISVCSKINQKKIRLNLDHACRILNLKKEHFFSMAEKLQQKQILTDATAPRPQDDRATTATLQTEQTNITEQTNNISTEPKSVAVVETTKIDLGIQKIELDKKLISSWIDTYDKEFLELEFKKARSWLLTNSHKAPKKNFGRFLNNWFSRGWESYRKGLTPNKPKLTLEEMQKILGEN